MTLGMAEHGANLGPTFIIPTSPPFTSTALFKHCGWIVLQQHLGVCGASLGSRYLAYICRILTTLSTLAPTDKTARSHAVKQGNALETNQLLGSSLIPHLHWRGHWLKSSSSYRLARPHFTSPSCALHHSFLQIFSLSALKIMHKIE